MKFLISSDIDSYSSLMQIAMVENNVKEVEKLAFHSKLQVSSLQEAADYIGQRDFILGSLLYVRSSFFDSNIDASHCKKAISFIHEGTFQFVPLETAITTHFGGKIQVNPVNRVKSLYSMALSAVKQQVKNLTHYKQQKRYIENIPFPIIQKELLIELMKKKNRNNDILASYLLCKQDYFGAYQHCSETVKYVLGACLGPSYFKYQVADPVEYSISYHFCHEETIQQAECK